MVDKCLHLGYNIYVEYKGALYAPMENITTMPTWGSLKVPWRGEYLNV